MDKPIYTFNDPDAQFLGNYFGWSVYLVDGEQLFDKWRIAVSHGHAANEYDIFYAKDLHRVVSESTLGDDPLGYTGAAMLAFMEIGRKLMIMVGGQEHVSRNFYDRGYICIEPGGLPKADVLLDEYDDDDTALFKQRRKLSEKTALFEFAVPKSLTEPDCHLLLDLIRSAFFIGYSQARTS